MGTKFFGIWELGSNGLVGFGGDSVCVIVLCGGMVYSDLR
jgi:hypothetical protein